MSMAVSEQALDRVIDEMIEVVENSKDEIFHISEAARTEYEQLVIELEITKKKVLEYIEMGDELEDRVRKSRKQLALVSKNFDKYSEEEIHDVYEKTHDLQTRLIMVRNREKAMRDKRDDIDRRLQSLSKTIERAEGLANKISVIHTYLQDDFQQVNEILENAKEKQEFGLKIIEAQEEERRKISREIHDGPAQMLANILLRSEIIEKTYRKGDMEKAIEELKDVRRMARSSLYEVRRIIYDLRPMALDDLGLVPTIKKYIDTTADYHKMDIDFTIIGKDSRLQQKYEIALFRLMQEALQNAIKHSQASKIQVKLEINCQHVILIVKDNGIGFDPSLKQQDKSFGLIGMKERVEMLKGTMNIQSDYGQGTMVTIKVPFNPSS